MAGADVFFQGQIHHCLEVDNTWREMFRVSTTDGWNGWIRSEDLKLQASSSKNFGFKTKFQSKCLSSKQLQVEIIDSTDVVYDYHSEAVIERASPGETLVFLDQKSVKTKGFEIQGKRYEDHYTRLKPKVVKMGGCLGVIFS